MTIQRNIEASKEGLLEELRAMAQRHKDSAGQASTQRRAERERGIAEGLELAASLLADTTIVGENEG